MQAWVNEASNGKFLSTWTEVHDMAAVPRVPAVSVTFSHKIISKCTRTATRDTLIHIQLLIFIVICAAARLRLLPASYYRS